MVIFLKIVGLLFMNYAFMYSNKEQFTNGVCLFILALGVDAFIKILHKHYGVNE